VRVLCLGKLQVHMGLGVVCPQWCTHGSLCRTV